jgi:hypothetical protein
VTVIGRECDVVDVALSKVMEAVSSSPLVCVPWPVLLYRVIANLRRQQQPATAAATTAGKTAKVATYIQTSPPLGTASSTAAETPSAAAPPALTCGALSLTHEELLAKSIAIRDHLVAEAGVVPGVTKVLVSHTDEPASWLDWACLQLALGMLGCTFTMLDVQMPLEVRKHVVRLFGPTVYVQCSADDGNGFASETAAGDPRLEPILWSRLSVSLVLAPAFRFCFVLFCFVLFCFVLFCFVLFVLFCFDLASWCTSILVGCSMRSECGSRTHVHVVPLGNDSKRLFRAPTATLTTVNHGP